MYMKRLNPKTNQPFKRGDVREDGKVFFNYTNTVKADGFFTERWLSAKSSESAMQKDRERKNKKYVRTSARLPKGYQEVCAHDKFVISQFRNAWNQKHYEGYSNEEILKLYEEFPEFHCYFGGDASAKWPF